MRYLLGWLACVSACSAPTPAARGPSEQEITRSRIVAHRGASHDAPENTLAAFRKAWDQGVECVELDVHVTRDGAVVVIHDADTQRTTGHPGRVADQTLAELRRLDAGSWKDPAFAGERIPTLGEVLATVPRDRTVFVEIKSGLATVPTVARAILAADPRPRGGHLALQAFDAPTLAALAEAVPGARAYWTLDPPIDRSDPEAPRILPYPHLLVDEARRQGFAGLALDHRGTDAELLAAAEAAGLLVDVWTINEPDELARWLATGARWIETDRPDIVPVR
jgi:glycerophosphoryl diester phosphodiesterase